MVALITLCLATSARADLIASDSFVCNQARLANLGGGFGWSGVWVTGQPAVFPLVGASLIGNVGGAVMHDGSQATAAGGRIFRAIDLGPGSAAAAAGLVGTSTTVFGAQPALGAVGTTVWLGFAWNGGTAGNGAADFSGAHNAQIHLYNGADTSAGAMAAGESNKAGESLAIGRGAANYQWNLERTCAHDKCPSGTTSSTSLVSTTAMDGATHWVVLRFDFVSASTTYVTLWLDPTLGAAPPADDTALPLAGGFSNRIEGLHFNWIELGGGTKDFSADEIRVATTFADLSNGSSTTACTAAGLPDAGPAPDAAAFTPDAAPGTLDAAPGTPDAAAPDGTPDAAVVDRPKADAGCGCHAAGDRRPSPLLLALAALLVARLATNCIRATRRR